LSRVGFLAVLLGAVGCAQNHRADGASSGGDVALGADGDVDGDGNVANCDDDAAPGDALSPEDLPEPLEGTQASRALGFKLYYRERVRRMLTPMNRLLLGGDLTFANYICNQQVQKSGNAWQVSYGPCDNNANGLLTFNTLHGYRKLGGRELELTLLRELNGMAFVEGVTGHPGVTSREALPNWRLQVDGSSGAISRTRSGISVTPPVTFSSALESELLHTFWDDVQFTYRTEPTDWQFTVHPLVRLDQYAFTFVFSGLPRFVRISNCCSSWIYSEQGTWQGAVWGNHNSRDNFADQSLGFLAAMDLADDPNVPADLRQAALAAAAAGHRVGDSIINSGYALMTVPETGAYSALIPGGASRPDGRTNEGPLGTINYCQAAYLAQALSTSGLSLPFAEVTLDSGLAPDQEALLDLLNLLGIATPVGSTLTCRTIDDASIGGTWGELLEKRVNGRPWYEAAIELVQVDREFFHARFTDWADSMEQLELTTMAVLEYARLTGKAELYEATHQSLANQFQVHRVFVALGYAVDAEAPDPGIVAQAAWQLYMVAVRERAYGIAAPDIDLTNLAYAESHNQAIEALENFSDTVPRPLLADSEIAQRIEAVLAGAAIDEPQNVERYRNRFFLGGVLHQPPLKRDGDNYKVVDAHGNWTPLANSNFVEIGGFSPFFELNLCGLAPDTLSCSWARLGCARPDLDNSGMVDAADVSLLALRSSTYAGQVCQRANQWCNGADFDHSGSIDGEDTAFMEAAQGCIR